MSPGLCGACVWARPITSSRGSTFIRCALSEFFPSFPKYPALPVLACPGHVRPSEPPPPGC
jgi:hypothetical protein